MFRKAKEVLTLVKKMLEKDTFTRGDYKELAVLVFVYLSGKTDIRGKQFKFSLPHNISHARFMQQGLNYVTLDLLDKQADYMNYSEEERREVELLAEFSALFYAAMFLQSSLAAEAPYLNLKNIQDLRKLVKVCQEELDRDQENVTKKVKLQAVQEALGNVYFHPDYFTHSNIVMALARDMMSDEDKTTITSATWEALERAGGRVESFPYKAKFYKRLNICSVWPEEEEKPNLRNFVGHESLLIFFKLDMADSQSLSWLTTEPKDWEKDPSYVIF